MQLRQYQEQAIAQIKSKRPLIYLATGSGKSVIFKQIAKGAIKKGNKVCFIVYGKSIVDQAARKHFSEITDKICMVMGPKKYRAQNDIYCCSSSTLIRNPSLVKDLISECKVIIIDEAHNAVAEKYREILDQIPPEKYVIGLTATPFHIGKKGHTYWDDVIHPITVAELVSQGHLVEPKVFGPPGMSTEQVKTTAGDYNNSQLFKKNDAMAIYGDIIKSWKKLAPNKKTLCFAINKKHALKLKEEFEKSGVPSAYADADTPQDERLVLFNKLALGKIKVLTNCNIASTGVDIPEVECVLGARPTKSKVLWVQQVGRALRPAPGKTEAIIIDHGGNCDRLRLHPMQDVPPDLEDKTFNSSTPNSNYPFRTCPVCFAKVQAQLTKCTSCDHVFQTKAKTTKHQKNVDLVEKKFNPIKKTDMRIYLKPDAPKEIKDFSELTIKRIENYGHKTNSYFFKMWDRFGHSAHIRYPAWFLKIKSTNTHSTKSLQETSQSVSNFISRNQEFSSDT